MAKSLRFSLLAVIGLAATAAFAALGKRGSSSAHASDPKPASAAPTVRLGVLHGEVDGFATEVGIADVGAGNLARVRPLATLSHTKGSAVRGALLPGREAAVVVAQHEAPRGTSYDGALYRVEGGKVTKLCADVLRATAPVVTSQGKVVVARGIDGQDPPEAEAKKLVLRVDDLTIDEVDPSTGATRTLWSGRGYQAFLAAKTAADEIVVYHSTPLGASLFALDPATSKSRVLHPSVIPFARDFSWDAAHNELVFANLAPDGKSFQVVALEGSGSAAIKTLFTTSNDHPMPLALPGGDVAISSDADHGLALLVRAASKPRHRLLSPLGDGSDAATHASSDGRWIAVRHTPATQVDDRPPLVAAVDVTTGRAVQVDVPSTHFVEAIGFLPGGAP